MSRKGNPYDNAACESFLKTLKQEEVYRNEYRDFHEARACIGEFLESVYNHKRLHSALGLRPRIALASAQVLPEWTIMASPFNNFSANGDYPLNFGSHSRGSLHL